MKEGWEVKTIGDVCISKSSNISQNKLANDEGEYPIFGASGLIKHVSFYHRDKPYLSIVKDGSGFGRITKMDAYTSVIGTLQYIIPKEDINLDYLNYFLMSVDFKKYVSGAAIPHIYFKDYKNEPFLWMPLPEQERIVAILEDAFAAIAKAKENAEQNLGNAKDLFESYLQGIFKEKGNGWEEKELGEIVDNIMTGPFGSMLHKSDYVEDGTPVINPQNIIDGQIVSLQKTMINEATFNNLKKYALKLGDIVIARRGEMGRCGIVKSDNVGWLCGTGSFVIRVNTGKADSKFLSIILSSAEVKRRLEKSSIGATMSNLNQTILSELLLNVPPVNVQQAIVQKLDTLSAETKRLEAIYQKKIEDLEELKKTILQRAFSGELSGESAAVTPRRGNAGQVEIVF